MISEYEAKSVSNETTFAVDISDEEVLLDWLRALTEQVTQRLRHQGLKGRTIQLKVRFSDFTTLTRSHSLEEVTDVTAKVWKIVRELFYNRLPRPLQPVRLIGVGVSNFTGETDASQPDLFEALEDGRQKKLDELLDTMQSRFGRSVVRRGRRPT